MKYLLLIASTLLLISCNSEEVTPSSQAEITEFQVLLLDPHSYSTTDATLAFESISYTTLETSNSSVLGEIKKIKLTKDSILIIDSFSGYRSVKVFGRDGGYGGELLQPGRGPHDLENPRDIIEYKDGYLIWDRHKMIYISKDRSTIDVITSKMNEVGYSFGIINNEILLYHNSYHTGMVSRFSLEGKQIQKIVPPIDYVKGIPSPPYESLSIFENSAVCFNTNFDTIWLYKEGQLSPLRWFRMKNDEYSSIASIIKGCNDMDPMGFMKELNRTKSYIVESYLENKSFLVFKYSLSGEHEKNTLIIDKYNGKEVKFSDLRLGTGYLCLENPIAITDDNELIYAIDYTTLKINHGRLSSTLKKIYAKGKIDDNPIIVFCKIKEEL